MLRGECSAIYEKQAEIPKNHSAVLRFRSSVVGDALNIPFKEVKVTKAIHPWKNPIADAMAYSIKTNGTPTMRSILTAKSETETRFIAPDDLVENMASRVYAPINFNENIDRAFFRNPDRAEPIISTLPMPVLMRLLDYKVKLDFTALPGRNYIAVVDGMEAYCSLYVPTPDFPAYRISLSGHYMIVESSMLMGKVSGDRKFVSDCADLMGLDPKSIVDFEVKNQRQAKILPINDDARKRFILWATEKYNVYSLGRFATWRPGLMMDDVVKDVRVIQKLAGGGSNYNYMKGGEV
jgi:hypothetical protein